MNKKLKNLNLKNAELVSTVVDGVTIGTTVAAAGAAVTGISGVTMGLDMQSAAIAGGLVAAGLSAGAHLKVHDKMKVIPNKRQNVALLGVGLAATALSTGLGVGVGVGTHKLTTAIINKLQPKHQIEQTIESEPRLVVDEIQVAR